MSKSILKSPSTGVFSKKIGMHHASPSRTSSPSRNSPRKYSVPNITSNHNISQKSRSEKASALNNSTIEISVKPTSPQSFLTLSENKNHWTSSYRHTGISPPPAGLDPISIQKWKKYSRTLELANRDESNHDTHHSLFRPIPESRGRELYFAVATVLGKSAHASILRAFYVWKQSSVEVIAFHTITYTCLIKLISFFYRGSSTMVHLTLA